MPVVGVGIDLVDVARLAQVLARTPGVGDRVFADAERTASVRRLAARFAAKEAAAKALGVPGGIRWREVEVVVAEGGAPQLRVHGHTAAAAARIGVRHWHLSLTHEGDTAVAVVVAES